MKRTQEEILARIDAVAEEDFFGTQRNDLACFLTFENAKPFLNPEATKESWKESTDSIGTPVDNIKGYMPFALEKAENHRGLSAGRSIEHFKAWLWLLGDDELLAFADDHANYRNYGVPILRKIGEKYGLELPDDDWFENMGKGKPCRQGCQEGCGR